MISPQLPTSPAHVKPDLDAIWVHIQGRAFAGKDRRCSTAAFRRVVRSDSSGCLRVHAHTSWRPHHPATNEELAIYLRLTRVGKVLDETQLDGRQWNRVHTYGLDAFLLEVIATRSFTVARQRALGLD
ncbi:hypothetical protein QE400_000083 [Xanthomonas sacchari]|uniref:hypothetical protein n=1 Tax=Xanthomonas sacchari TaxID=56458 RepID=UPI00277F8DF5|nr:hypothetical protein [Xanthomonas sacchari]MDQ1090670.1 hypothetical protein [Xanthomonas sacchari]